MDNEDVKKHIEKSANSAVYGTLGGTAAGAGLAGGSLVMAHNYSNKINHDNELAAGRTYDSTGKFPNDDNFDKNKYDELQDHPGMLKRISDFTDRAYDQFPNALIYGPAAVGAGLGIYSAIKHGQKAKQIQNDHINSLLNKNKK